MQRPESDPLRFPSSSTRPPAPDPGDALGQHLGAGDAGLTLAWLAGVLGLLTLALTLNSTLLMSADWRTLIGQPGNPDSDSIEMQGDLGSRDERYRVIHLRINHAEPARSLTGISYRSFDGLARVDCVERQARYLSVVYYGEAGFKGKPLRRRAFDRGEEPPVRLLGFEHRLVQRVVDLGCL